MDTWRNQAYPKKLVFIKSYSKLAQNSKILSEIWSLPPFWMWNSWWKIIILIWTIVNSTSLVCRTQNCLPAFVHSGIDNCATGGTRDRWKVPHRCSKSDTLHLCQPIYRQQQPFSFVQRLCLETNIVPEVAGCPLRSAPAQLGCHEDLLLGKAAL